MEVSVAAVSWASCGPRRAARQRAAARIPAGPHHVSERDGVEGVEPLSHELQRRARRLPAAPLHPLDPQEAVLLLGPWDAAGAAVGQRPHLRVELRRGVAAPAVGRLQRPELEHVTGAAKHAVVVDAVAAVECCERVLHRTGAEAARLQLQRRVRRVDGRLRLGDRDEPLEDACEPVAAPERVAARRSPDLRLHECRVCAMQQYPCRMPPLDGVADAMPAGLALRVAIAAPEVGRRRLEHEVEGRRVSRGELAQERPLV